MSILNNWKEQFGKFNVKQDQGSRTQSQKFPSQKSFSFRKPGAATTNTLSLKKKTKVQSSLGAWIQSEEKDLEKHTEVEDLESTNQQGFQTSKQEFGKHTNVTSTKQQCFQTSKQNFGKHTNVTSTKQQYLHTSNQDIHINTDVTSTKKPQATVSPLPTVSRLQKENVKSVPVIPQLTSFMDFDDDDFTDDSLFLPSDCQPDSRTSTPTTANTAKDYPSIPLNISQVSKHEELTELENGSSIARDELDDISLHPAMSPLGKQVSDAELTRRLEGLNKLQCKLADTVCTLVDNSLILELLEDTEAKKLKQSFDLWKKIKAKSKQVSAQIKRQCGVDHTDTSIPTSPTMSGHFESTSFSNSGSAKPSLQSMSSLSAPKSFDANYQQTPTQENRTMSVSSHSKYFNNDNTVQGSSDYAVQRSDTSPFLNSDVSSFQSHDTPVQSSHVSQFQSHNDSPVQSSRVSRFQSPNDSPVQNSHVSQFKNHNDTTVQSSRVSQFQKAPVQSSQFQRSSVTSRQGSGTSSDNKKLKGSTQAMKGQIQGVSANEASQFSRQDLPHSKEMLKVFRQTFALHRFRTNQLEAVNATLMKKDCFILMPTGGGKSLCYQLPGAISQGLTLVVSPLRSLIQDQVQKLCLRDIPSTHLSSDVDAKEADLIYRELSRRDPQLKLLYVTPEKISSSAKLMTTLENLYARNMLARFVIDEAHCVSQWGHDFRPDYKRLHKLREKFPKVPIMALTATATPRVRTDIVTQLRIQNPIWFIQSFNRSNLKYSVLPKKPSRVTQECIDIIKGRFPGESGIIYCLSRNECDKVAGELTQNGISAKAYHAGLDAKNRTFIQQSWVRDEYKVVCATIAFGMGIDKPDVRFVLHHSLPKSIEGYYQESGRAGRDGNIANCILFYSYQDMIRLRKLMQRECDNYEAQGVHLDNLYRMVQYCENDTDCRRAQLLHYLGENDFDRSICQQNTETACDNCLSTGGLVVKDVTELSKSIVDCVDKMTSNRRQSNRYTLTHIVDILRGAQTAKVLSCGHNRLPLYSKGSEFGHHNCERLLRKLVLDGFLREEIQPTFQDQTALYVYTGNKSQQLIHGNTKVTLSMKTGSTRKKCTVTKCKTNTTNTKEQLKKELQELCRQLGREYGINHAHIFASAETLQEIVNQMPQTHDEMLQITGVTEQSMARFGQQFLDVILKYSTKLSGFSYKSTGSSSKRTKRRQTGDGNKAKRRKTSSDQRASLSSAPTNHTGKKPGFLSVPKTRPFLKASNGQFLG